MILKSMAEQDIKNMSEMITNAVMDGYLQARVEIAKAQQSSDN